jgi:subtilisin family serine protease
MSWYTPRKSWVAGAFSLALAAMSFSAFAADNYLVVFEQKSLAKEKVESLVRSLGGTVVRNHAEIGVAIVTSDEPNFHTYLANAKGVFNVQQDLRVKADWSASGRAAMEKQILAVSGPPVTASSGALSNKSAPGAATPDPTTTPFWPFQWNLAKIGLVDVFADGQFGDPAVKVAILGAGIDYRHPDLEGRVDLDLSRSFVPSDDALVQSLFPGAHPIADLAFHTTHVAGQIACNVRFLSCVAPNVTLVGVKVQDFNEEGSIADLVSGIVYGGEVADVVLVPFTYWGPGMPGGGPIYNWKNAEDRASILAVRRAVNYATRQGALVVTETSTPFFQFGANADTDDPLDVLIPSQAGALTIGASGRDDVWSNISNYGSTLVDLVAPGGWADPTIAPNPVPFSPFREFIWGACSSFSQFGRLKDECAFANQPQFLVVLGAGPASAHAAAVAALIDSQYGGRLKGGQLKAVLFRSAVDLESPGYDPFTGHGRIDAKKALGL